MSASVLLQLNNYMRVSMGEKQAVTLELLQIHYDTFVDLDKVVDGYGQLHPHWLNINMYINLALLSTGNKNPPQLKELASF